MVVKKTSLNEPETVSTSSTEAVTIRRPKKKNKKKKYSRNTKSAQEVEVAISKGAHRLSNAVVDGIAAWRKERDRSGKKKRDGAIKDALENVGRSVTKFGREAARVPEDITDALPKMSRLLRPR